MRKKAGTVGWTQGLLAAGLSVCVAGLAGCVRTAPSAGAYRLVKFADVTVLAPPGLMRSNGSTQDTMVLLGKGDRPADVDGAAFCEIRGSAFALRSETQDGRWRMTSPTAEAWNTSTLAAAGESEWLDFTAHLATLAARGCFAPGISSYTAQRRIVEAIPIPADRALRFFYSLTSSGFVDLQPGMQIRIETVLPPNSDRRRAPTETLALRVMDRTPNGVTLAAPGSRKDAAASEDIQYGDLPQTFRMHPYLRLFLEQAATGTERPRKAMLLGGSTAQEVDAETRKLGGEVEAACPAARDGLACVSFPNSSVSLLTSVTLNGHTALYAPGTTLAQIVDAVPEARRARALATVSLARRVTSGLVPVVLPRTEDGLVDVSVINGDVIRWRS